MFLSLFPFHLNRLILLVLFLSFSSGIFASTLEKAVSEKTKQLVIESPENTQDEAEQKAIALEKATKQEHFLMLQKAFEEQRFSSLSPEETKLNGFLLDGYVRAWSILTRSKLGKVGPSLEKEAHDFLKKYQGQYIAERFQTDWLKTIAPQLHEQQQWDKFINYRKNLVWNFDEPEFQCWDLYHSLVNTPSNDKKKLLRLERQTLETLKSSRHASLEVCKKASATLIEKVPSSAYARTVVLIQQGRIDEAKQYLDFLIDKKRLDSQAKSALENSDKWFERNKRSLKSQNKYVALIAAYQLSRNDYEKTAQIAQGINHQLTQKERAAIWGRIGYVAALDHDPKALQWYAKGGKNVCSSPYMAHPDACQEWRVRSALRQAQWQSVRTYIDTMPQHLRQKEAWIYWRGYALRKLEHPKAAKQEFMKLKNIRTFYGKLAAEALGLPTQYRTTGTTTAPQENIAAFANNESFKRAKEFYDLSLLNYGHREWNWGLRNGNAWDLLAAALWAQQNHLWHRMINTSERVAETMPIDHELLYPRPYRALIENYSKVNSIRDDWVYGLIRQESRFISVAQSPVGANGLMQIMPTTAKWIAKNLQDENFDPSTIYEANTNIRLGTAYLRSLLDRLDQNMVLATAGYNAGPNRAKRWRASLTQTVDGAIFIESIPFTETRGYVQNVMANMMEYSQQGSQPLKRLSEVIGTISPKPIDAEETI